MAPPPTSLPRGFTRPSPTAHELASWVHKAEPHHPRACLVGSQDRAPPPTSLPRGFTAPVHQAYFREATTSIPHRPGAEARQAHEGSSRGLQHRATSPTSLPRGFTAPVRQRIFAKPPLPSHYRPGAQARQAHEASSRGLQHCATSPVASYSTGLKFRSITSGHWRIRCEMQASPF